MRLIAKIAYSRSGLEARLEVVWILLGVKALVMRFEKQIQGSTKVGQVERGYVYVSLKLFNVLIPRIPNNTVALPNE